MTHTINEVNMGSANQYKTSIASASNGAGYKSLNIVSIINGNTGELISNYEVYTRTVNTEGKNESFEPVDTIQKAIDLYNSKF